MKQLQIAEGCDEMAMNRTYRIGNKVRLNDFWHHNVHLDGGPESESNIPGGTTGTVVEVNVNNTPDVYLIATALGTVEAHYSYLDPVRK